MIDTSGLPPFAAALAELCHRRAGAEHDLVAASAALVAGERSRGHTGVALAEHAGRTAAGVRLPEAGEWARCLLASGVVGDHGLLTLAGARLALARDARAERRLAANLAARLAAAGDGAGAERVAPLFAALFPGAAAACDWQAVAAAACLRGRLTVISGGPGTGKTTTVAKVLALLLQLEPGSRIALCAPTGKAAARLAESITAQAAGLPGGGALAAAATQARTLHRLLGYDPRLDRFRHHPGHPLAVDCVVLDEASMADLLLMDALLAALPAAARLIVLGDAGQLASVEAGYVLGDLSREAGAGAGPGLAAWCTRLGLAAPPTAGGGLAEAVVELRENFRFRRQPGIGALATALRGGDGIALQAALAGGHADVVLHDRPARPAAALAPVLDDCLACVTAPDAATCLERFAALRILTPLRGGPWGATGLTAQLELELRRRGAIAAGDRYRGRPVLVTANDHRLDLFNGDVGVLWDDGAGPAAWFAGAGGLRRVALARLPAHETAWAMTVHKAQGSEFDRVLLVLPPGDGPFLTRELVYTAVTRARRRVDLVAEPAQLLAAALRSARRSSGLVDALG
jgi:exodeoxyribonuclease V alpha subunit